jgi:hypothetical protein|tara:strand:- start:1303 stop:1623 length:321 start_codon:yes stop_codon:yes gene_type:complete
MKQIFEYVLLTLAFLAVIMIIINREGFSNSSTFPSTYKDLLLNSFKPSEKKGYQSENYDKQAKNVPTSEMSSYAQVTSNIPPNLIASPCNGNEPFPNMCSSLYASY